MISNDSLSPTATIEERQQALIAQGYDVLECPRCEKACKPTRLNKNESVSYETHDCQDKWEWESKKRSFRITANGDLVMR